MEIQLKNITKKFNEIKILENITMKIEPKKSSIILGKSGCGKSVLIKIIYKLINQENGIIKYDKNENVNINDFAMLFQYGALFDSLTIWENIAFQAINEKKTNIADIKNKAMEIIKDIGLKSDTFYRYPAELSGGMKKRVALGRALFKKPKVIFLDEPTTGLDPVNSNLINELIIKTIKEKKITAITITHDIKSAQKTGDVFFYLEDGVIETSGNCINLFNSSNSKLNHFMFS